MYMREREKAALDHQSKIKREREGEFYKNAALSLSFVSLRPKKKEKKERVYITHVQLSRPHLLKDLNCLLMFMYCVVLITQIRVVGKRDEKL